MTDLHRFNIPLTVTGSSSSRAAMTGYGGFSRAIRYFGDTGLIRIQSYIQSTMEGEGPQQSLDFGRGWYKYPTDLVFA